MPGNEDDELKLLRIKIPLTFLGNLIEDGIEGEYGLHMLAFALAVVGVGSTERSDAQIIAEVRGYLKQIRNLKQGRNPKHRDGTNTTITIPEICTRLGLSEETVYDMLKAGQIPNIRLRRLFIISRAAYEDWEKTIGTGKK